MTKAREGERTKEATLKGKTLREALSRRKLANRGRDEQRERERKWAGARYGRQECGNDFGVIFQCLFFKK